MKIYENKESKNRYKILSDNALMKNPVSREWEECVIYVPYETKGENGNVKVNSIENQVYVREKSDFLEKFKEVYISYDD